MPWTRFEGGEGEKQKTVANLSTSSRRKTTIWNNRPIRIVSFANYNFKI